jgi:pilus assembly protein CpaF
MIVVEAPGFRRELPVTGDQAWVVGRGADCDVVVADARLSRRHLRVTTAAGRVRVEDLGSANGTFADGVRCSAVELAPGSTVAFGGATLRVTALAEVDVVRLHAEVLERLELHAVSDELLRRPEFRSRVRDLAVAAAQGQAPGAGAAEVNASVERLLDEVFGLGPLEPLLADETVTEIMVNAADEVWVERGGRLHKAAAVFSSEAAVRRVVDRIVAPLGRRVDESSPLVDARLADGSRVNAVIPPLALKGAALTIRKFARRALTVDDLLAAGSLDERALAVLSGAVRGRKNLLVSGGTGSGKTTLLNVLAGFIDPAERIVTIEDAAELRLPQPHVVRLESRPPSIEGTGGVTIRDLLRNALRMRPDRIVVGECRGGEALDMLQAMNTGHDGSLSTVHANSTADALRRLETLVLFAGADLPHRAVREQVAAAIHFVVQQARDAGGRRRVTAVTEVAGLGERGYELIQRWPA